MFKRSLSRRRMSIATALIGLVAVLSMGGAMPAWPTAILLRALAAPVLAPSMSFFKNPGFLALGVVRPPNPPPLPPKPPVPSQPTADCAPCLDPAPWLRGVGGRSPCPRIPAEVTGRTSSLVPDLLFLLARLPALVALKAPAE